MFRSSCSILGLAGYILGSASSSFTAADEAASGNGTAGTLSAGPGSTARAAAANGSFVCVKKSLLIPSAPAVRAPPPSPPPLSPATVVAAAGPGPASSLAAGALATGAGGNGSRSMTALLPFALVAYLYSTEAGAFRSLGCADLGALLGRSVLDL